MKKKNLSIYEDDRLRVLVRAVMSLMPKKIVEITRELKFSSGAISGWLNGGIDRLSEERKNILAAHLGIQNGTLSPSICHIFRATKSAVEEYLHLLIDVDTIYAKKIFRDSVEVGVLVRSSGINMILLSASAGTKPSELIVCYSVEWGEPLFLDKNESVEKVCDDIFLKDINKNNKSVEAGPGNIENYHLLLWMEIFKKIIESGLSTTEVIERLGLY